MVSKSQILCASGILRFHQQHQIKVWASFAKEQKSFVLLGVFTVAYNVVDRGVLQAMWEELAASCGQWLKQR